MPRGNVGSVPYRGPLYQPWHKPRPDDRPCWHFGVGHDNVDKSLARRHGVFVTNTPGTLDTSVAEHTLWLLGNLAKQINRQEFRLRQGQWNPATGIELHGKTLAVIGFGAIGRRVAAAAHFGFGMRVIAVGSRPADELQRREGRPLDELLAATGAAEYTDDLVTALSQADAVTSMRRPPPRPGISSIASVWTCSIPEPCSSTRPAAPWSMKRRSTMPWPPAGLPGRRWTFSNMSLIGRSIAEKDLRNLDNVLLTPHIGSNTVEANRRMAESVLESVRCFLAGNFDALPRVDAV